MSFAFAAAGTGGHVYPALAVAEALVTRGVARSDIVFFGGDRMEAATVPAAGFPFVPIEIRGLRRSLDRDNLRLPGVVWKARAAMRRILQERSVVALAAFGGYVTVPAVLAASSLRVPVVLQEQNAIPGLANRLMARMASSVFVAFPAAATTLRGASVVGNPLRSVFDGFEREHLKPNAIERYDLKGAAPVIGVLGGSLGAKILNESVLPLTGLLAPGSAVLHLTGRAHAAEMQRLADESPVTWRTVAFEESMEYFYAAADLVLSRAGALTISELALTGTPAVVVPYAAGTAGHQAANAAELAAAGALRVVPETDIASVPRLVAELAGSPDRLAAMSHAASGQARRGAADAIADALLEVSHG